MFSLKLASHQLFGFDLLMKFFSYQTKNLNDFVLFAHNYTQKSSMKSKIKYDANISQNSLNFSDAKIILYSGTPKHNSLHQT